MYKRHCQSKIEIALKDTPVVIVSGPRQSGKTTLAKQTRNDDNPFITLDDETQFSAAKRDPVGFIRNLGTSPVTIDEIQRVPELLLAIKQSVDENRAPGRFLLTGSSNALLLPNLADSLAGRMEVINLLPLADCEISGTQSTFLKKMASGEAPTTKNTRVRNELIKKVLAGGFPEPLARESERRMTWYQQYINSIVLKDLKDLGNLEHLAAVPKLIRLLANQVSQLTQLTELANKLEISRNTINSYISLLELLYLFYRVPPWHVSHNKRLIKTPKIQVVDSGLLCALRQLTEEKITTQFQQFGHVLESYVVNEVQRLATWYSEPLDFFHYRDKDKTEVDLIIETYGGKLMGIEVKAAATISSSDFNGLRRFKQSAGSDFVIGIVLYDGDHTTEHEPGLFSVPFAVLWE